MGETKKRGPASDRKPTDAPKARTDPVPEDPLPRFIAPQLCTLKDRPPSGTGWIHEIKFDGYRLQLKTTGAVRLLTRNGHDWTQKFPSIAAAGAKLPSCTLDGELTALDDKGAPHFSNLQSAIARRATSELVYFAFDILALEGNDLRKLPLIERKAILERVLGRLKQDQRIRYVEHFEGDGPTILKHVCGMELEGLVSKRANARYSSGRSPLWVKVKCYKRQQVAICGWLEKKGRIESFLVGEIGETGISYLGRIGASISNRDATDVLRQLRTLETDAAPFPDPPPERRGYTRHWAEPLIAIEVSFLTRTASGSLRHSTIDRIVALPAVAHSPTKKATRRRRT